MVTGILSPVHVAFLLVIVVLLFGAKRLPELGSSLGSGLRDFRKSLEGKHAHAQVASVVDANASPGPTASALRSAPPPVAQPSVVQPGANHAGCRRAAALASGHLTIDPSRPAPRPTAAAPVRC
jgi:sec-independent protein translocase protein TatA